MNPQPAHYECAALPTELRQLLKFIFSVNSPIRNRKIWLFAYAKDAVAVNEDEVSLSGKEFLNADIRGIVSIISVNISVGTEKPGWICPEVANWNVRGGSGNPDKIPACVNRNVKRPCR